MRVFPHEMIRWIMETIRLCALPVGGTLFVLAKIAKVRMGAISRGLFPMFAIDVVVLLILTCVEAIPMPLAWLMRG
jgi:C4-dicarboxylate transporter, DctM subunit